MKVPSGRRIVNFGHKLRWGCGVVGVPSTVKGLFRLAKIFVVSPGEASVDLGSAGRLTFAVPSELSPALVVFGRLIDPEYDFLRRVMKPGWEHWDVGAAVGQYSVFAGLVPGQHVLAFEPNPTLNRRLRQNIDRNALSDRVETVQLAVSDQSGEVRFSARHSPFVGGITSDDDAGAIRVSARTLDDIARDRSTTRIDVLKVNVAGFEPEVLRGAHHLFEAGMVRILITLISTRSIPEYHRLTDRGYRLFFYNQKNGVLHALPSLTELALNTPPSPARHLIAIHEAALPEVLAEVLVENGANVAGTS